MTNYKFETLQLHVGQEEAGVLEYGQKSETDHQRQDQPQTSASAHTVDQTGTEVADEGHTRQKKHQSRSSPCVEYQGEKEEYDIFCLDSGCYSVHCIAQRKKG